MDNQDEVNQSNEENLEEIENLENGENLSQEYQQPVPRELTEKEKAQKAGRDVAEIAAKGFAQAYGGDLGGKAVDAVLKTKGGQKVLDSASKKLNKSPVTKKLLSKAEPAISEAKPQINQAVQGLAGGNSTGPKQNEFMNRKGSNIPSLSASNSSLEDSNSSENSTSTESNKQGDGFSLMPKMPGVSSGGLTSSPSDGKGDLDEFKKMADLVQFFIKYKWPILIGIAAIFLFAIIISFYYTDGSSKSKNKLYGLNGYQYFELENKCETVTVYNHEKTKYTREIDFETEYIPGVLYNEVRGFHLSSEAMKLYAIAARTYALTHLNDDCSIEGSTYVQSFPFDEDILKDASSPDNDLRKAADATFGLILIRNNSIAPANYDAGCYRKQDENYYYFGYGKSTIGTEQLQGLPKEWVENQRGLIALVNQTIEEKDSHKEGWCAQGHALGFSQYGAYYLATEKEYDLNQLIDYYFANVQLVSIYPGFDTNYTATTTDGAENLLNKPIDEYLAENDYSVEEYNEFILKNIVEAGFGTREAAIATALSLTASLEQNFNIRLPYLWGGLHNDSGYQHSAGTFYGLDPKWGISTGGESHYGPDCSGFVSWVLYNAGFNVGGATAYGISSYGEQIKFNGSRLGDPGDLIYWDVVTWDEQEQKWKRSAHIMFIVGVDEEAKVYYIAHASGSSTGVKISTTSFNLKSDKTNHVIIKMDKFYENRKLNITTEEFIQRFRAGYLVPYTGKYDSNLNIGTITKNSTYFVGDSRTVGVCTAASVCNGTESCDTNSCLALNGSGSSWLSQNLTKINNAKAHNIVINLGVNDLTGNPNTETLAQTYFNYYETIAHNNPNKIIYITSVGPVGTSSVTKDSVESFNNNIEKLIDSANLSNLEYLDTYSKIKYDIASDGIHYNNDTYKRIYNYIMGEI